MVLSLGSVESYGTGPHTANHQPGKLGMWHSLSWHGKQHHSATSNKQCLSLLTTMKLDTFSHLVRLSSMIHTVLAAEFSSHTLCIC